MTREQMLARQNELLNQARTAGRAMNADERAEFDALQRAGMPEADIPARGQKRLRTMVKAAKRRMKKTMTVPKRLLKKNA